MLSAKLRETIDRFEEKAKAERSASLDALKDKTKQSWELYHTTQRELARLKTTLISEIMDEVRFAVERVERGDECTNSNA